MTDNIFRGRQYPLVAAIDFTAADNAAAGVVIKLPPGALLIGGAALVTTVFNGTTPALTATDSASNSLFGSVAGGTAAQTDLVAGHYYPLGTSVTVAVSGAPTTGEAFVNLSYVIVDRTNEVYSP